MLNKQDEKSKHNDFLSEYQEQLQMIEEKLRDIEDSAAIIHSLLEAMLIFYGADRAYVIEADWDLMVGVNTYEICADGVTSHFDALQYLPGEIFPRWAKQLMNNQPVIITDTELIKEESPDEYALLKLQDIRSCLATPFSKKFNKGFIGVDNPTRFEDNPSYLLILTYAVVAELNEIKLEKRVNDAVAHFTQSSGSELYINCFGGLEIKSANGIILDDSISSDQCYQLLAYLIMNRKRVKPVRELADILWPNAAIEDPYHDVKNVVYRLKRFLSAADLDDLVIGSNGTYILNPKYVIRTDFDRFEEAYERFFSNTSDEIKCSSFMSAQSLYKGGLLPRIDDAHWLMPKIGYYHNLYLRMIKALIIHYFDKGNYFSAQKVIMNGLATEPYDTDLMTYMTISLFMQNNRSLAASYYAKIESDLSEEQIALIGKYQKS